MELQKYENITHNQIAIVIEKIPASSRISKHYQNVVKAFLILDPLQLKKIFQVWLVILRVFYTGLLSDALHDFSYQQGFIQGYQWGLQFARLQALPDVLRLKGHV